MPRFFAQLVALIYGMMLVAMLCTVLLTRFIGGEAVALAWAGVERNADWQPVVGLSPGGIEFVLVPAGCFMMGSTEEQVETAFQQCKTDRGEGHCQRSLYDNDQPVHQQCFDAPFWIGRYEVTNAQYQTCVDTGACELSSFANDSNYNDLQQPVVGVDWFHARDYAEWTRCQLPTEASWEYAARGPDNLIYPWGEDAPDATLLNYSWMVGTPTIVGNYSPAGDSWAGAADMAGNMREWTSTIYLDSPYDANDGRENAADRDSARVLRGGAWSINVMYHFRTPARYPGFPTRTDYHTGFRCARLQ